MPLSQPSQLPPNFNVYSNTILFVFIRDAFTDKPMDFLRDLSHAKRSVEDDPMDFGNLNSPTSRIASHYEAKRSHKRSHSMAMFTKSPIGTSPEFDHEIGHEQVMEALRAKIQRTRNQSGPSTIRNQPPLRHRRSHSAVVNRQKGEVSSRSPSSDSLSMVGEFSSSPQQEPSVLADVETSKESTSTTSASFNELDPAITDLLYDPGEHSDSVTSQ